MNRMRGMFLGSVLLFVVGLGVEAAGDGEKAKDLIVGKWKMDTTLAEFTSDGNFTLGRKFGTYKVLNANTLELTFAKQKPEMEEAERWKIQTLTKTKLTLMVRGKLLEFDRVTKEKKKDGPCSRGRGLYSGPGELPAAKSSSGHRVRWAAI